ncbi:MAG: GNAT family N-acetyltransferase [Burkholderiaceae bacterium]|nr:GNAT family N-acetyltransferase [Burkholderiaceae bacterium]
MNRPRSATPADFDQLADVFTASVREVAASHYDAAQRDAWAPVTPDYAGWRERFAGLQLWLVEAEDDHGHRRMAGFLGGTVDGHLDLLFTAPGFARRGVAAALYQAFETHCRAQGTRTLRTEASLVARPFFERQGFAVQEEQQVVRRGVVLRRFAMRRTLD